MKKILISALMVITSYGAQSQNLWKAPVLPEEHIEVSISEKPTEDEIKMSEEVLDTIPQHRVGPPHFGHPIPHGRIQPPMMMLPKPESIIRKGDKVILIFNKNEFDKFRKWHLLKNKRKLETEIGWQKRVGQHSTRRVYLERNPKIEQRH